MIEISSEDIYKIKKELTSIVCTASDEYAFKNVVHASLTKSAELCHAIFQEEKGNSFLFLSSLRGICEDYISLRFIHEFANTDRDNLIIKISMKEEYESSISQWNFFKCNKPDQKLYYRSEFLDNLESIRLDIKGILEGHPINRNKSLPNARYMAEKIGEVEIYEYIYHATSSFVHFNPRILMRMGWGDLPEINFSTKNFYLYYRNFAMFYGCFLLVKIYEWSLSNNLILDI